MTMGRYSLAAVKNYFVGRERAIVTLLCISFFVGIWHALPLLNVVTDEWYFVGGVVRAMEHHTFIPLPNDVYRTGL